ncbi:Thiol-disulfide isomerase-like thioredoxin [Modestobacter italicus]|uniref:Thiol-disulfide isomerase-like thioredoxin n=1 Tax=Modestobacter italicus (strain DSM 44449 / CECT 9708 / BC 501) TaxID=2732864 RepID=I4ERP6_MODI5|nr:TlpA disulfide reductase family protein [Modestobacter marinus]CCH86059.1 Thiol-disulfide isomerase-like thioredoxin [Modestobacter marinus]
MSRALRAAGALLVLFALLAGCTSAESDEPAPTPASSDLESLDADLQPCPEQPDQPAADSDLPATVFDCFGGGTLDLSRAPGVPTVVNLWASWCGPCREELPLVQQLADAGGERVRVLGVASLDGASQTASFAKDAAISFPSAFDGEGEVMAAIGVNTLPHTIFLAADGSIAYVQVGQVQSLAEFEQLVADHLGVQL